MARVGGGRLSGSLCLHGPGLPMRAPLSTLIKWCPHQLNTLLSLRFILKYINTEHQLTGRTRKGTAVDNSKCIKKLKRKATY